MNNIKIACGIFICTFIFGCKAPQATIVADKIKTNIPPTYPQQADTITKSSALVPWREFFTDPQLVQLIEEGLKNNQDLMITIQQIAMAKNDVDYQNGRLKPVLSAEVGAGVSKEGRYTSEGAGNATTDIEPGKEMPEPLGNFGGVLALDWEVDIWHKLRTEKQSAVAHYLVTVEGKNFVLSSLIAEIANNYYDLLELDNRLDIIQQYIQLQQRALEIARIQKEAMAATELAVKKFEAELAKSKATEYTLRQEITEKENELNRLLGHYPQPIVRNKQTFMTTMPQVVYTGIPADLLANRLDIKQAELELKSAQLDVDAARKEFYPSLNISAALGLEAFKPSYLVKLPESVAYNALGKVVAPLINRTAIQAQFKNANAKQIAALYEYDKTLLEAYLSVANLMSKIKNLDNYYQLKTQESQALDSAIGIANQLFKNSRADYLEVLTNQRDALDAKMELIEAKQMQLNTVVDIYKNLGGGWR